MSQSTDQNVAGIDAAPTVDEALAALTASREPGASSRRLGWRRERGASHAPTLPVVVPEHADAAAGKAPAAVNGTPVAELAEVVSATNGSAPSDAVAVEALGPYIARLMVDARQAAADFQHETERETAERAAAIYAAALADAEAIRARAMQEADAILDAARIQARSLASRVVEMAAELTAGADVLAQPAAPAAAAAPITSAATPAPAVDSPEAATVAEPEPATDEGPAAERAEAPVDILTKVATTA